VVRTPFCSTFAAIATTLPIPTSLFFESSAKPPEASGPMGKSLHLRPTTFPSIDEGIVEERACVAMHRRQAGQGKVNHIATCASTKRIATTTPPSLPTLGHPTENPNRLECEWGRDHLERKKAPREYRCAPSNEAHHQEHHANPHDGQPHKPRRTRSRIIGGSLFNIGITRGLIWVCHRELTQAALLKWG
jgi:hypothetical protein